VADLGLSPRVLAAEPSEGWYITAYETGARPLTGVDFAKADVFAEVAALLTRLHRAPIRFPFQQGLFQAIDLYLHLAPTARMLDLRQRLSPVQAALARSPMSLAPCHIDPNPANFLRCADGRLQLIDWEFAAMEEPLWDLAAIVLEAGLDETPPAIEPLIGAAQMPRLELYRTTLNLVAASWCEAEIAAGNDSTDLVSLRDQRIRRLEERLADPRHMGWLQRA
jgi:thiamine kinase-like enzyme